MSSITGDRSPAVPAHGPRAGAIDACMHALGTGTEYGKLRPMRRLRACRADWVALNHRLAGAGVLAQCHRADLKTMIWTVDED